MSDATASRWFAVGRSDQADATAAGREAVSTALAGTDPQLLLSVNLSARQVAQAGLVDVVRDALESSGLEPGRLSLEITETVLLEDAEGPIDALRALKELGVKIVLDDFGTGYSSLGYLKRLPLDALKIDRSFIDGLGKEADDTAIVSAVVGMARGLGLALVAEGVETPAQADALRARGCGWAQGYYFGRPGSPADFQAAALRAGPPAHAAAPVQRTRTRATAGKAPGTRTTRR